MKKEKEDVSNVVAPEYGVTVHEMNANALTAWMHKTGSTEFGWSEASDVDAAQTAANTGSVVILLAANAVASKSGHVSVVLAESGEHHAHRDETTGKVVVPLQSQAGSKNFKYSAEPGAPGSKTKEWWKDAAHKDGAAWIFDGATQGALVVARGDGHGGPRSGVSARRWARQASAAAATTASASIACVSVPEASLNDSWKP